jgi:4'-phosphopantetheinyl transferase
MINSETLHPVILPVPDDDRWLKGREKVKALSREARNALSVSAQLAGLPLQELSKDERGAPLPSGSVYWSVSHKSDYVAAVVSIAPVGIDLERIRAVQRGLFDRIASDEEWRLADAKDEYLFARFWTAKESVLKAVGQGLTGLSDCRIAAIEDDASLLVAYREEIWTVAQRLVGADHLVAVAITGKTTLVWHPPEV